MDQNKYENKKIVKQWLKFNQSAHEPKAAHLEFSSTPKLRPVPAQNHMFRLVFKSTDGYTQVSFKDKIKCVLVCSPWIVRTKLRSSGDRHG